MSKKWVVCFLACLTLLFLAASAQADFALDFEGGIDGFFRSGSCQLVKSNKAHTGQYSLGVEGRAQNDYDAADYAMQAMGMALGDRVTLSFFAYHEGPQAGIIKAGLGSGSYAELARATVEPNTWTQITGTFTVSSLANMRFQTYGAAMNGVSFYIDDVTIAIQRAAAPAPDTWENYAYGFETDDLDGWYDRNEGGVQVSVTGAAAHGGGRSLLTTGRTQSWNSPARAFTPTPGQAYVIKVFAMQNTGSDVEFILSAAVTRDGQESYMNLIKKTAKSGEWVELSASYAADFGIDKTLFYMETTGAPEADFYMDDFTVAKKVRAYRRDLPSLKDKYQAEFLMGCAVTQPEFADRERIDFLAAQFNSFTPANELKPENVFDAIKSRELAAAGDQIHPAVKFGAAKPLLDYAKAHDIAVHGHVLVWHSQTPKSFFTEGYLEDGPLVSREVMLNRLENYIAAIMAYLDENYPGLVMSWDVVNEAVLDSTGALRGKKTEDAENGTYWMDTVGKDYIVQAFAFARKYAPQGAQLYYNDYSVPYEPKLTGIKAVVGQLWEAGLVNGMGFQGHYQLKTPGARQVSSAMQHFYDLGMLLRVSEMDITIAANTPEEHLAQARRYQSLMQVFLTFADRMDAVTVWGTSDDFSWKASQFPLLFDGDMTPKPAFWAWADPSQLPPENQAVNAYGPAEPTPENFSRATKYALGAHMFSLLFDAEHLYAQVLVQDGSVQDTDAVTVFLGGSAYSVARKDAQSIPGGYAATVTVPVSAKAGGRLDFDVLVKDGSGFLAWNDRQNTDASRSLGRLNLLELKECAVAVAGKPDMTAGLDPVWETAPVFSVAATCSQNADEDGKVRVSFRTLWQPDMLYVLVDIVDSHLDDSSPNTYMQDSIEVFIDEGNHRVTAYESDDGQYRVNFQNLLSIDHGTVKPISRVFLTEMGFTVEIAIPFISPMAAGSVAGFDVRYNNAAADGRRTLLNFSDAGDTGWQDTRVFGLIELK